MRYLTKEWYELGFKTNLHYDLRVTKKAEVFSEEYFQKLYKREEAAWVQLHDDSKFTFEDLFPCEFKIHRIDGLQMELIDIEKEKKTYFKMRENARVSFENRLPFDPEQEKKNFRQRFWSNVKRVKRILPSEILEKIADIRVFSLNRVSADIKREVASYCKANEKTYQLIQNAYFKECNRIFKNGAPDWMYDFNFPDCKIVSCRKKGKDIVITLDNSKALSKIEKITLVNGIVLKQDKQLHGAWWLRCEIYPTNAGYEIHLLLEKNERIEFTVFATDVKYI